MSKKFEYDEYREFVYSKIKEAQMYFELYTSYRENLIINESVFHSNNPRVRNIIILTDNAYLISLLVAIRCLFSESKQDHSLLNFKKQFQEEPRKRFEREHLIWSKIKKYINKKVVHMEGIKYDEIKLKDIKLDEIKHMINEAIKIFGEVVLHKENNSYSFLSDELKKIADGYFASLRKSDSSADLAE